MIRLILDIRSRNQWKHAQQPSTNNATKNDLTKHLIQKLIRKRKMKMNQNLKKTGLKKHVQKVIGLILLKS